MTVKLLNWEIIRHGIEYPDYFQGCGIAFTRYSQVATGIGSYEMEALQDALEEMTVCHDLEDGQLERIESECTEISENQYTTLDYLADNLPDDDDIEMVDEAWYYVSIRFNVST